MPTTIPQLSHLMKQLLTTTADRLAAETGFVQRVSKLSGSLFARTLVFSWWQDPAAPCAARARLAATLGCPITDQGFDQRFSAASAAFLQALLGAAVQEAVQADPVAIPVLRRFAHVEICDGSVIALPAVLAALWPGCGHATASVTAALKFVVRFDLTWGRLYGPHLTPARRHDLAVAADLPDLPPDSLFIGDLGFFSLEQFAVWATTQRYWLSRYKLGTGVAWPDGTRVDLVAWLTQQGRRALDVAIRLGVEAQMPCRLIAARVPASVVRERRADLQEEARRRQTTVSADAWELACWTLLVTNCPAERLSGEEVLALGEARWQVELLIKRWKSLGQIDEWQTANPQRILTEIAAKLLVLVLQHWLLVLGCWREPAKSLWRGLAELQRWGHTLAWAGGQGAWEAAVGGAAGALRGCRIDKRRKDQSTYQRLLTAAPPAAVNSVAA
jgi:Transposase DDE domain